MVAASIRESLIDYVTLQDPDAMQDLLERAATDGHLLALGFCDVTGNLRYRSSALPNQIDCRGAVSSAMRISEVVLEQGGISLGKLLLVQDTDFIQRRSDEFRFYLSVVFLLMFLVISALGVWIAHWSWLGWVSALKNFLRLETSSPAGRATPPEFLPLVGDLRAPYERNCWCSRISILRKI